MKRFDGIRVAFVLGLFVWAPAAQSAPVQSVIAACIERFVEGRISGMANLSHRSVHWRTSDGGHPVDFELGDSVGAGYFGRVYDVTNGPEPSLVGGYSGPLVAKLAHYKSDLEPEMRPAFASMSALKTELSNYSEITTHRSDIMHAKDYPKDPAWGEGLPLIPIVGAVQTVRGLVLFKPKIRGKSLVSFHSIEELNDEMRAGLQDILSYGRAVNAAIPKGFVTDLRPPNIVWMDDPAVLENFGYKRPGWALFEQTRVPFKLQYYAKVNLADYLNEASGYMKPLPALKTPKTGVTSLVAAMARERNFGAALTHLHDKLGPIFLMKQPVTGKNFFFVTDPEVVRLVLMDTDRGMSSAFEKSADMLRPLNKLAGDNNLFSAPMESWKPQRKQLAPAFTAKETSRPNYTKSVGEIVDRRVDRIQQQLARSHGSTEVDFKDLLHRTTLDVILRLLFRHELPEDQLSSLAKGMQDAYQAVLVEGLNPLEKPIHTFPAVTSYQRRFKASLAMTEKVIEDIIHKFETHPQEGGGFMGLLMSMRGPTQNPITRGEVRDQILAFLFAGHETTAHTLTWAFHEIASDHAIQDKLVQLIRNGNEAEANEYIDQIWSEALRMHMPISLLARQAVRGVDISSSLGASLRIPRGSTLVLNTGIMQRREDLWGVAKTGYPAGEFHPERFSPENRKAHAMDLSDDFKNYAFGAGPRFCIGASLASVEARKIIFEFFKKFNVSEIPGGRLKVAALNDALIEPHSFTVSLPK